MVPGTLKLPNKYIVKIIVNRIFDTSKIGSAVITICTYIRVLIGTRFGIDHTYVGHI